LLFILINPPRINWSSGMPI